MTKEKKDANWIESTSGAKLPFALKFYQTYLIIYPPHTLFEFGKFSFKDPIGPCDNAYLHMFAYLYLHSCVFVYLCTCVFVYQAWYLNGIPLLLNSCQRGAPPNISITLNIFPHEWKAYSALFHKYLSKHPFINSYLGRFWILAQQIPHNDPGISF